MGGSFNGISSGMVRKEQKRKMANYKVYDEKKEKVIAAGSAKECAERIGLSESSVTKMTKKAVKGMTAERADDIEGKDEFERKLFCMSCGKRTYDREKHAVTECTGKCSHSEKSLNVLHEIYAIYEDAMKKKKIKVKKQN